MMETPRELWERDIAETVIDPETAAAYLADVMDEFYEALPTTHYAPHYKAAITAIKALKMAIAALQGGDAE